MIPTKELFAEMREKLDQFAQSVIDGEINELQALIEFNEYADFIEAKKEFLYGLDYW